MEEDEINKNSKTNFIKDVWNSITKIEKYPELASRGLPKAIKYLVQLIILFAIVINIGDLYEINKQVKEISQYIEAEIPDFTYNEGFLNVNSEETIVKETTNFGKIIINTKEEDENQINNYIDSISKENIGVVFLKDKAIIKTETMSTTINYNYSKLLEGTGITQFTKQKLIDFMNSNQMFNIYISLFIVLFFYTFIIYIINTLINILGISLFGYVVSWVVRMRMKYKAIFNMSIYAVTLSTVLGMIYILLNYFTGFTIKFFDVMYITVASIYLIAAILIIKSDFIKKQGEVVKIAEVEKTIKEDNKEESKEENPTEKKDEKKDKEDKKDKQEPDDEQPEGSNA